MAFSLLARITARNLRPIVVQGISVRGIHRWVAPTILEMNRRKKKAIALTPEQNRRSNFIEWNYNAEIYAFGKRLREEFKIELLLQAFIHRSYIVQEELKQQELGIESPTLSIKDNSEMKQLGEKLISDEVVKFLSASFPRLPAEFIQSVHNYLVSDETLADISKNLGTTDIILTSEYPPSEETFANTLKAIIGALAMSQSTETANIFIVDFILTRLAEKDVNDFYEIENPLKTLVDILSRDGHEPPEPRIIAQSAMNEILACYTVGLYSSKIFIGSGHGETVAVATEMAARDALKRLFKTTDSVAPLRFSDTFAKHIPSNLSLNSWKASAFNS